jgi:uncharacterized repeat protein (TIGR01451 family)
LPDILPAVNHATPIMTLRPDEKLLSGGTEMKMRMNQAICIVVLAASSLSVVLPYSASAQAQNAAPSPVALTSDVKIERVALDAAGKEQATLHTPKSVVVVPGDKVLFTLEVINNGAEPASGFRATNPIPAAVKFTSVAEDWADVSVDGGATWGKLAQLKIKAKNAEGTADVERAAVAADVTHVRWIFADAIAPGAKRAISYRGEVR